MTIRAAQLNLKGLSSYQTSCFDCAMKEFHIVYNNIFVLSNLSFYKARICDMYESN